MQIQEEFLLRPRLIWTTNKGQALVLGATPSVVPIKRGVLEPLQQHTIPDCGLLPLRGTMLLLVRQETYDSTRNSECFRNCRLPDFHLSTGLLGTQQPDPRAFQVHRTPATVIFGVMEIQGRHKRKPEKLNHNSLRRPRLCPSIARTTR